MRPRPLRALATMVAAAALLCANPAAAQSGNSQSRASFSLSSSRVATTHESPAIYLTYRRLDHLDFRIYRVSNPVAFLAGLKDPHQLGSEEPLVDQEPTTLERIADWKADWRSRIRSFFRAQFTHDYRQARRQQLDRNAVVLRRTINVNSFAQVPLLNRSLLVTSWREMLPSMRDADVRRIPIDVKQPGMYVVEAVLPPHRAYTIVIVSDIGLITKAAPGQVLAYTADRTSGKPLAGCDIRVLTQQKSIASGTTGADGVFNARFTDPLSDDVITVARCGEQTTATDPGSWYLHDPTRELVGYVYTDKPIYRPGHTVHVKAFLRWRAHGALGPFDAKDIELRVSDITDKVIFRQHRTVDAFDAITGDIPLSTGAALGYYSIAVVTGDETASGSFEVQEYRKPEFGVRSRPPDRFIGQERQARVAIDARYYFGQPVANARVAWVAHRQPYYSPLRGSDEKPDGGGGYWWGEDQALQGTARLDANGKAEILVPMAVDERGNDYTLRIEARVTDASSREVSGKAVVHATYGDFLIASSIDAYVLRPGGRVTLTVRAVDYVGNPQASRRIEIAVGRRQRNANWDSAE